MFKSLILRITYVKKDILGWMKLTCAGLSGLASGRLMVVMPRRSSSTASLLQFGADVKSTCTTRVATKISMSNMPMHADGV